MATINERIKEVVYKITDGNGAMFARSLNMNKATLHNYMNDRTPKLEFLVAVHEKYNVSLNWLLTGNGEMETKPKYVQDNSRQYLEASHAKIEPKLLQDAEGETIVLSRELIDLIPGIDAALKGCTELAKIKDTPPELIIDTLYRILDNAKKSLDK